jgi:hypothetical protein
MHRLHDLVVQYSFDGRTISLVKPYAYVDHDNNISIVPANFSCDGSSIPRLVWTILGESPMRGPHLFASIVHDYQYRDPNYSITRKQSDDLYFSICVKHGMSKFKALVMWAALRLFAGDYFVRR